MHDPTPHTTPSLRRAVAGAVAILATLALLVVPSLASATPQPVTAPAIPGTPALPGNVVDAGQPAATMAALTAKPDVAPAGTKVTFTASGLPAGKDVTIVWMTANVRYILDAKPDSVDYIGRKVDKIGTALATAKTDASGALNLSVTAPVDFGGLHDIFAVVDGVQVAKGGFLLQRQVSISPKSGPVGTLITVKVVGMGSPTYESVGALNWDNHYVGAAAANTTRGSLSFKIRAAGDPGVHWLEYAASSHTVPYLNTDQSPVPWTASHLLKFTITKDAGLPARRVEWPATVAPTIDQRTTLAAANLDTTAGATAQLSTTSGEILTKVDVTAGGLTPNQRVDLTWSTVVGNRVNCTGTCWNFVSVPLGTATAGADGTVKTNITVPDGLGGWHVVQLSQGGTIKTQVPFYVKRSLVQAPKVVKAGHPFIVQLKGVGWTQLDNTIAVTYDNAYIGYACGFNSNGDTQIQLLATGKPGTHLIDLYPLLYTQQPAYPYPQLGMVPLLSFAQDAPGLAAGYQLGAFRLAIKVVK
jgi:hypothetical protein